jgi:hypothetical protein
MSCAIEAKRAIARLLASLAKTSGAGIDPDTEIVSLKLNGKFENSILGLNIVDGVGLVVTGVTWTGGNVLNVRVRIAMLLTFIRAGLLGMIARSCIG